MNSLTALFCEEFSFCDEVATPTHRKPRFAVGPARLLPRDKFNVHLNMAGVFSTRLDNSSVMCCFFPEASGGG